MVSNPEFLREGSKSSSITDWAEICDLDRRCAGDPRAVRAGPGCDCAAWRTVLSDNPVPQ
jgi:hypothetical protein